MLTSSLSDTCWGCVQGSQVAEQLAAKGFAVRPPASVSALCPEHWCAVHALVACAPPDFLPVDDPLRAHAATLRQVLALHEEFFAAPPASFSDTFEPEHLSPQRSIADSDVWDRGEGGGSVGSGSGDGRTRGAGASPFGTGASGEGSDNEAAAAGGGDGGDGGSGRSITEVFKAVSTAPPPQLPPPLPPLLRGDDADAADEGDGGAPPSVETFGLESARLTTAATVAAAVGEGDACDARPAFTPLAATAPIAAVLCHFHRFAATPLCSAASDSDCALAAAGADSAPAGAASLDGDSPCNADLDAFGEAAPAVAGVSPDAPPSQPPQVRAAVPSDGKELSQPDVADFPHATPVEHLPAPPAGYPADGSETVPASKLWSARSGSGSEAAPPAVRARELPKRFVSREDREAAAAAAARGDGDAPDRLADLNPGDAAALDAWRPPASAWLAPADDASSGSGGSSQSSDAPAAAPAGVGAGAGAAAARRHVMASPAGSFGRDRHLEVRSGVIASSWGSNAPTSALAGADEPLPDASRPARGAGAAFGGGGGGAFGGLPDVDMPAPAAQRGTGQSKSVAASASGGDDSDSDDEGGWAMSALSSRHRAASTCLDLP